MKMRKRVVLLVTWCDIVTFGDYPLQENIASVDTRRFGDVDNRLPGDDGVERLNF